MAKENVEGFVGTDSAVKRRVDVTGDPPPAARRGAPFGEVVVAVDGERVGASRLVAAKGHEETPVWRKVRCAVEGVWKE